MVTELLKSAWVTDLDATPAVRDTAGKGPNGPEQVASEYITTTTGKTTGSVYRMLRVPTNCKVKQLLAESAAQGSSTAFDLGVYYSANPTDPNYAAHAGAVVDADFFATALDYSSAVAATDVTNESGTYTVLKRNKELWDALGLTVDPKGYFDIAFTSTATINTGASMGLLARFVI